MRCTSLKKIFTSDKQTARISCQEIGLEYKNEKEGNEHCNTSGNGKL